MMSAENRDVEQNMVRLLRAAFGPEVRPNQETSKAVLERLQGQLAAGDAPVAFPQHTLGLLTGILALMAAWLGVKVLGVDGASGMGPTLSVIALVLILNWVCVPVAGIIIVMRRRYVC